MIAKRALGLFMALFALMIVPAASVAQDTGTQTQAPATGDAAQPAADAAPQAEPAMPWVKFCGDLDDGRKLCIVRQIVTARNKMLARFIVRNNPAEASPLMVLASMPLGVTLPYGLRLQIDNGRELILPYIACDSQLCNVRSTVNEAFINSLKRGAVLKLKAKNARGSDVVIEIDLAGFTATYDGDQYISLEGQQQQDTNATDKLGQAVQDLAEQMRRQQSETTPPPDAPPANGQ